MATELTEKLQRAGWPADVADSIAGFVKNGGSAPEYRNVIRMPPNAGTPKIRQNVRETLRSMGALERQKYVAMAVVILSVAEEELRHS